MAFLGASGFAACRNAINPARSKYLHSGPGTRLAYQYPASRVVLPLGSVVRAAGSAKPAAHISPFLDNAIIRVVVRTRRTAVAPRSRWSRKRDSPEMTPGSTVPGDGAPSGFAHYVWWNRLKAALKTISFCTRGDVVFNAVLEKKNSSAVIPKYAIGSVLRITGDL